MPNYTLGIDIGGTKIQAGLVNKQNKIIQEKQFPNRRKTKQQALDSITKAILDYHEYKPTNVGISITGIVDPEKGIAVKSPNLPKTFYRVPLSRILEKKLHCPVFMENDGNCIALAESVFGEGRGNKTVFSITIGTGVGSGLVIDKKIYHGTSGIFEFGHTFISDKRQKCSCGQYGHLESFVSGKGLVNTYHRLSGKKKTSYEIIKNSKTDPLARHTLDETSDYLAKGLANIVNAYNPGVIVIGGGLSDVPQLIRPGIKKMSKYLVSGKYKKPKVKISKLKYKAGILGAALLTRYNYKT